MNAAPSHKQHSTGSVNSVLVVALVFFAIAGLISGMAVGAFTHQKPTASTPPPVKVNNPPIKTQKSTPTPTPSPTQAPGLPHLGTPKVDTIQLLATGPSTLTIHAYNKDTNQPVHDNTITCRLWLTNKTPPGAADKERANKLYAALMSVGTLNQPMPEEIPNSLTYSDPAHPATQTTDAQGVCKWSFQIAPGLKPGTYYVVADTDWKGLRYPFVYFSINIPKA